MLLLEPVDEGPELEPDYALHVSIIRRLGREELMKLIPDEYETWIQEAAEKRRRTA